MFYSADKTEDLNLGHSMSDNSERLLGGGKRGGARIDRSFCNKDQVVGTSNDYWELRKTRLSQVKEFSAFLCTGRCKVWAH